jgi:ubiquinone/menaquinone biosynthesis C-methylase UbiE
MEDDYYRRDAIRAVDARAEAQKLAFAPLAFQAARALKELGILRALRDAGERGLSRDEAADHAGVSRYGAGALLEMGLGLGLVKLAVEEGARREEGGGARFTLGKTGWFLLEDRMTAVNFDFVNDVCYRGAADLAESARTGKPCGLAAFGDWPTIYQGLSSLPEQAKKSWFAFDHFYSDIAFTDALPVVFAGSKPANMLDIGGNTGKWALLCCRRDETVRITVADLPAQTAVTRQNAAAAGFQDRVSVWPFDALDPRSALPEGHDTVWMSQFLDCFAPEDITALLEKIAAVCGRGAAVWVLEPLWDRQRFRAAAYSLQAASLYFTCMANGRSKIYGYNELRGAVEAGGFALADERHNLGSNSYSLLKFVRKK